jgi:hypothetical protein
MIKLTSIGSGISAREEEKKNDIPSSVESRVTREEEKKNDIPSSVKSRVTREIHQHNKSYNTSNNNAKKMFTGNWCLTCKSASWYYMDVPSNTTGIGILTAICTKKNGRKNTSRLFIHKATAKYKERNIINNDGELIIEKDYHTVHDGYDWVEHKKIFNISYACWKIIKNPKIDLTLLYNFDTQELQYVPDIQVSQIHTKEPAGTTAVNLLESRKDYAISSIKIVKSIIQSYSKALARFHEEGVDPFEVLNKNFLSNPSNHYITHQDELCDNMVIVFNKIIMKIKNECKNIDKKVQFVVRQCNIIPMERSGDGIREFNPDTGLKQLYSVNLLNGGILYARQALTLYLLDYLKKLELIIDDFFQKRKNVYENAIECVNNIKQWSSDNDPYSDKIVTRFKNAECLRKTFDDVNRKNKYGKYNETNNELIARSLDENKQSLYIIEYLKMLEAILFTNEENYVKKQTEGFIKIFNLFEEKSQIETKDKVTEMIEWVFGNLFERDRHRYTKGKLDGWDDYEVGDYVIYMPSTTRDGILLETKCQIVDINKDDSNNTKYYILGCEVRRDGGWSKKMQVENEYDLIHMPPQDPWIDNHRKLLRLGREARLKGFQEPWIDNHRKLLRLGREARLKGLMSQR